MKVKCLLKNYCISIGLSAFIVVLLLLTPMTSQAQDTVPPTFVPPIPMDTTVSCDNVPSPANVTATDTCEPVSIDFSETRTDGSCPGDYSLRRVWVASDNCGNEDSVVQIVTVIDTTAPEIINASQDTTVSCDAPVPSFSVMTSENCSGTLTSYSESVDNNTTCPVTRVITRTFVASDLCGNSDTVMQVVTIIDTTPPAFDQPAPADTTISCSSDVPPPANLTASDNCQGETVTFSEDTTFGSCPSNYELRRVWTASDDCANEDSVVQIISIMDTTPPQFDQVAPSDTTVNCDELFPMDTLTATDNCGNATVTMEEEVMPGGCTGENTLRRVWRAEDDCGNIDSVEQFIMVIDTIAPTFDTSAPADTTVSCESVPPMAILTATDNCDTPTINTQEDTIPGTCPQDYTLQRMWIASDACGNADTVQQTVTVIDTTAPVFDTNPMDTVVDCDATIPNPSPTATDNCGEVTMTAISSIVLGTCPTVYVISRSWTAEDECGNSATVSQQVIVQDTTPPTITCPADTTIACTTTADTMNTGMATANDGCSMPTITFSDDTTAGSCAGNYTITRTFVAEDSCGNSDSCTQTITVIDTVAPVFNEPVPTDTTIACDAAVPPPATLTSTDNCGTDTVVYFADTTAGSCPQEYTINRTWIASDDCGNSRVGSQVINVVDTVAPVFDSSAPADTTVDCDAVPAIDTLTATDNCGMATVTMQEDTLTGTCPQEYTLQRMWVASDECGNADTMQQMVSVLDTVAPIFDSPAPADTTVECDAVPPMATLSATDNCGMVTITTSEDTTAGTCPQEYTLNRVWMAEDECGNIDSVQQTVMVIDTTAPVFDINPADTTVDCDAVVPTPSPMATDNCGAVTMTASSSISQGACPNEFIINRTWTATDECGNSASVSQTVFIQDTTAPVIICPADITIECTTTADTSITGMATATDNCDTMVAITYSDDTTAGDCAGNYTIERTFVAEDTCGNIDSCTQTITVIDTVAPVFNEPEPSDTTIACDAIVPAPASITATDNCSMSGVTYRADTTAGVCPQEFTIRRIWTAADSCGNVDSMDQVIMIIDTVAPVFNSMAPADTTVNCDGIPPMATLTATDNCGDVILTTREDTTAGSCPQAYTLRRVWTAADSCGNVDSMVQTVNVIDTVAPVFDSPAPADTTVECDAVPPMATLSATDNCGMVTITTREDTTAGACPQQYTLRRVWTAEDECGNVDSVDQTLMVIDTTAPVFDMNPMDTTVDCDAVVPTPSPMATDNCGDVTMTASSSIMQGSCPNEFVINRTWTATDECGNSTSVNQTVTIQDTTAPVITCPADVTIECTTAADTSVTGMASATDNCETDVNITFSDDTTAGICAGNYVIARTFVADDSCGNVDSCTQTITVIDTVAPVFNEPEPADTAIACDAAVPGPATITATDNCSMSGVSYRADTTTGACSQEFTIRRVWTAADSCGNVDSMDQLIMIIDTVAPVFDSLPEADTTIDCNQAVPIAENLTATDNCGTATVTLFENFVSGACPQESTTTRIWVANDGCGNTDTVTRVIMVQDTFVPVFDSLPPADTVIDCDAAVPPAVVLTATDTCGTATVTFTEDTTAGSCPQEYTLTRTWVAEDECGNSDTVGQTVMIQDTTPPGITCPADITIECTQEADTSVTGVATATDNCDTMAISITYSDDTTAGICAGDYSIERTFVAEDTCGNIDSCVQTITVIDTVPPVINNVTPSSDTTIACDEPFPLFGFGVEEECSATDSIAIHQDTIPGACPQEYTIRIVYVAGDDCGNIDSVIRLVNVIDTVAPAFDNMPSADTTIACDAAVPAPAMLTATDNCDTAFVIFRADTTAGSCPQEYTIRRVWTAMDSCGNADSVDRNIMVVDTSAPVFDNPQSDTTVSCDAVPPPAMVTATDNCGMNTVTFSADTTAAGTCPQEYTIRRVWTTEDECGNVDSSVQMVMVVDTTGPVITCPSDTTISCDLPADTSMTGVATASDNCGAIQEITYRDSLIDNVCLDTIYRIWTATDSCGNSSECTQSISLLDTVPPMIGCEPDTISCELSYRSPTARFLYAPSNPDDPQLRADIAEETGMTVDYFDARSGTPTVAQLRQYDAVFVWANFAFANNQQYGDNLANYVDAGGTVILGQFNTFTNGNFLGGRIMEPGYSPVTSPTGGANFTSQSYNGDGSLPVFNGVNNLQTNISDQLTTQGNGAADGTYSATGELVFAYRPDYKVTYVNGFADYSISSPGDWEVLVNNILTASSGAVVTDNCSGVETITFSDDTIAGACAGNYTIERTTVASDYCGNIDSCIKMITVIDTVAPVFDTVPPADTTIACDAIVPSPVTLTVTDNCSAVSVDFEQDTTDMTCPSEYTIRRVWTATDNCGNSDSVTRNIFIVDTVAPQIMTTSGDTTISCEAAVPDFNITVFENCSSTDQDFTEEITPGACEGEEIIFRKYVVNDQCGNSDSVTQTIMVVDTSAPVFDTMAFMDTITVECSDSIPTLPMVSASDTCSDAELVFREDTTSGACPQAYTLRRVWTATDSCGNMDSVIQVVNVIDTVAPMITCPSDTIIDCSANTDPSSTGMATATDNCDTSVVITYTDSVAMGVCDGESTIFREWVAKDSCNNSDTCVQVIILIDTMAPEFVQPLPMDDTVTCDSVPLAATVTAVDSCSDIILEFEETQFDSVCEGTYKLRRVWTATDSCNNSDSVVQVITVIDTVPPAITLFTPDTVVSCDSLIPGFSAVALDNCSGESTSFNEVIYDGNCPVIDSIVRTYIATDGCGNADTITQTVLTIDTVAPQFDSPLPPDTTIACDAAIPPSPVLMTSDNCSGVDSISETLDTIPGTCESNFTIIRAWTVVDSCGNANVDSQTITVVDTVPPSLVGKPDADTIFIYDGDCSNGPDAISIMPDTVTPITMGENVDTFMVFGTDQLTPNDTVADNCSSTDSLELYAWNMSFDSTACTSTVTVNFRLYDDCGNYDSLVRSYIFVDTMPPDITWDGQDTVEIECASDMPVFPTVTVVDSCDFTLDTMIVTTDSVCVNQKTVMRSVVATDECGLTDTVSQIIIVNDTVPPMITSIPPDITVECDDVPSDVPSATDNCDTVIITYTDQSAPGACPQEQTITRTFTVSDECGNSVTAQQTIEVIDTTVPFLIDAPEDMTLNCDETPPYTPPVVEDNCDPNPEITFEDTYQADPNCPQGGRIDRVFTISDACGNSYILLQQFEFIDTTAPVIEPIHPDLVGLPNGGTLEYQCFAQDPNWELEKFEIADFEITDNCSEDIQVMLEETVVSQGDCLNDGYLARTEYTITADDQCGNVTTYNFFVEVIDTIAPELFGVPSDITISCEEDYDFPVVGNCEHAEVYAEDECECGNVEELRDTIPGSCPNEYSVIVTYIATDNCGNTTTGTYTITVVDENSPVLLPRINQLIGVPSGSEVEVDCHNGDFPSWVHNIGPNSLMAIDNCGSSELTDYSMNTHGYNDCFDAGALGYNDYSWTYEDECGNVSTYSLRLLLVDHTPPVIVLDNEIVCEGDSIETPQVTDNCGDAKSLTYEEFEVIDECSGEEIVERVWTARDYCGNIATATQKIVDPVDLEFDFAVDILAGAKDGDTISLECSEVAELTPSEEWITLSGGCFGEGEVLELSVDNGQMDSTCANGVIRLDTWTWLVEDICGEIEEIVVYVEVRDELAPIIPDFESQITMMCGDERPMYEVVDACGSPSTIEEISFELISGDTCQGRTFERGLLTSDACGNEREYMQTVIIEGDMGPEILGIPGEAVCDESELENVSAFDHCAGTEVPVRFEDLRDEECGNGERTLRVYSATSMCGTESRDSVYIVSGDDTEASYQVVGSSLQGLKDGSIVEIECDRDTSLRDIEVSESDVVFLDDCDPDPEVTFTDRIAFGNCRVDGYLRTRILTWESRDACGNVSRVRIEFRLVDTQAPQFFVVPDDVTILCDDEYEFEEAIAVDACYPGVEVTYEDSDPRMVPEGTLIVRTWTADDGCGNVSTVDQRIVYDNGDLACSIEGPVIINCAEDDVRLSASVKGGLGPYNYEWIVTGGVCEITQGQGTSNVLVDVGFSNAQITLLVEDQLGCITTCQIDLICDLDTRFEVLRERDKREYNLYQNIPNPFDGVTTIGFSLPEDAAAVLKVYDASGKQVSEIKGNYEAGYNEVELRRTDIPAAGVFYYELTSGDFQGVKRMVLME